jgi:hypothetical protein
MEGVCNRSTGNLSFGTCYATKHVRGSTSKKEEPATALTKCRMGHVRKSRSRETEDRETKVVMPKQIIEISNPL